MIYTSNYDILDTRGYRDKAVSISGDKGHRKSFFGDYYKDLAPLRTFWDVWKSNIGKIPEEENNKYYIREYYDQVLSKLNVDKVRRDLDEKILLCYEDENSFCHRQIVAAWLELYLPERVMEIKAVGDRVIDVTNRKPIKDYLEEYIKSKTDMRGFHSLKALHYYEKSEKINKYATSNRDIELAEQLMNFAFDLDDEEMSKKKELTM